MHFCWQVASLNHSPPLATIRTTTNNTTFSFMSLSLHIFMFIAFVTFVTFKFVKFDSFFTYFNCFTVLMILTCLVFSRLTSLSRSRGFGRWSGLAYLLIYIKKVTTWLTLMICWFLTSWKLEIWHASRYCRETSGDTLKLASFSSRTWKIPQHEPEFPIKYTLKGGSCLKKSIFLSVTRRVLNKLYQWVTS